MANHLQVGKTYRLNNDVFLCQRTANGQAWFLRDLNKSRTWNGSGHVQGYLINDKGEVHRWAYDIGAEFPNRVRSAHSPIPEPELSAVDFIPCLVSSKEINFDDLVGEVVWKGRDKSKVRDGLNKYLLT